MKNACTKKVLTTRASTNATSSSTGSSRSKEPFLAGFRPRWEGRPPAAVPLGASATADRSS
jgi:hypothetical protein